jgi:hypothetical protein
MSKTEARLSCAQVIIRKIRPWLVPARTPIIRRWFVVPRPAIAHAAPDAEARPVPGALRTSSDRHSPAAVCLAQVWACREARRRWPLRGMCSQALARVSRCEPGRETGNSPLSRRGLSHNRGACSRPWWREESRPAAPGPHRKIAQAGSPHTGRGIPEPTERSAKGVARIPSIDYSPTSLIDEQGSLRSVWAIGLQV